MTEFNHNAVSFNAGNMRYLAWCANLVYEDADTIERHLSEQGLQCGPGFFFSSETTDTEGFIVGDADKIILAFRGTEADDAIDWLTDVHALKTDFTSGNHKIGEVHRGFYDALLSVWGSVYNQLKRLRTDNQKIWITGHSLGGALATLAAATLIFGEEKSPVQGMYTFGQPRVGDHDFCEAFNIKIGHRCFRMVFNEDIVTLTPATLLGFRHIGTLKHCDANCHLFSEANKDDDKDEDISKSGLFSAITDHGMANYQKLAQTLLSQGDATA